ncbi:hypothetical protein QQ045_027770 [Rhodiola kirilowii]
MKMGCFPCLSPRPKKDVEKKDKPKIEDVNNIPSAARDSGPSPANVRRRAHSDGIGETGCI